MEGRIERKIDLGGERNETGLELNGRYLGKLRE